MPILCKKKNYGNSCADTKFAKYFILKRFMINRLSIERDREINQRTSAFLLIYFTSSISLNSIQLFGEFLLPPKGSWSVWSNVAKTFRENPWLHRWSVYFRLFHLQSILFPFVLCWYGSVIIHRGPNNPRGYI